MPYGSELQKARSKNEQTYIVHVRCDLLDGIGQLVKGFVTLVAQDLVLHTDDRLQKDIVERLGFHADVELLDAKAEATHLLFKGADDHVAARLGQTGEEAKAAGANKTKNKRYMRKQGRGK